MAADRYQHNDFIFKTVTALRIVVGVAVTLAVLFVMVWLIDYSSDRSNPETGKPVLLLPDHTKDLPAVNRQDPTFFESLLRKRAGKEENDTENENNVSTAVLPDEFDSEKSVHSPAVATPNDQIDYGRAVTGAEHQSTVYAVQLGSFQQAERARMFSEKLAAKGYQPYIMNTGSSDGTMTYRVRVGRFATREEAKTMAAQIERSEKISVFVTSQ